MHLILILAVTGVLLFGAALGLLSFAEANPPPVRADSGAVIVLGCQVYSTGNLSPQLELRLRAALPRMRRSVCVSGAGTAGSRPRSLGGLRSRLIYDSGRRFASCHKASMRSIPADSSGMPAAFSCAST